MLERYCQGLASKHENLEHCRTLILKQLSAALGNDEHEQSILTIEGYDKFLINMLEQV
jgi:hypothetical protein